MSAVITLFIRATAILLIGNVAWSIESELNLFSLTGNEELAQVQTVYRGVVRRIHPDQIPRELTGSDRDIELQRRNNDLSLFNSAFDKIKNAYQTGVLPRSSSNTVFEGSRTTPERDFTIYEYDHDAFIQQLWGTFRPDIFGDVNPASYRDTYRPRLSDLETIVQQTQDLLNDFSPETDYERLRRALVNFYYATASFESVHSRAAQDTGPSPRYHFTSGVQLDPPFHAVRKIHEQVLKAIFNNNIPTLFQSNVVGYPSVGLLAESGFFYDLSNVVRDGFLERAELARYALIVRLTIYGLALINHMDSDPEFYINGNHLGPRQGANANINLKFDISTTLDFVLPIVEYAIRNLPLQKKIELYFDLIKRDNAQFRLFKERDLIKVISLLKINENSQLLAMTIASMANDFHKLIKEHRPNNLNEPWPDFLRLFKLAEQASVDTLVYQQLEPKVIMEAGGEELYQRSLLFSSGQACRSFLE